MRANGCESISLGCAGVKSEERKSCARTKAQIIKIGIGLRDDEGCRLSSRHEAADKFRNDCQFFSCKDSCIVS